MARSLRIPVRLCVALLTLGLAMSPGCRRAGSGAAGPSAPSAPLRVVVSIVPLRGLVEPVARAADGERAEVSLLVPIGASEHGYEIPPEMIASVVRADVVVYVGMGLEPQLEGVLLKNPNPGREVVCFADVAGLSGTDTPVHHDGNDPDADHDQGPDPHLWLDPVLVRKLIPQVRLAIERAVSRRGGAVDQQATDRAIAAAAGALDAQAVAVDEAYRHRLGSLPGRVIVTAHAAWGRLAARYGLEQVALAGLEGAEPSPGAIAAAIATIRQQRAGTIFVEPQISPALANRIASETGARVSTLDPLGTGDWAAMMNRNLDAIVAGLSQADKTEGDKTAGMPPH